MKTPSYLTGYQPQLVTFFLVRFKVGVLTAPHVAYNAKTTEFELARAMSLTFDRVWTNDTRMLW